MNICVTNLSHKTSEDAVRYAFSAFGQVRSVSIVGDETTGELKAVVSMPVEHEARTAISKMNGTDFQGRIVQAVGQAKTNILRRKESPGISRPAPRGAGRNSHGRTQRGRRRR